MNNRIEIIDTTLRDGQQSPLLSDAKKYFFTLDDKLQILESLILLGVKYFELFSPIVSKKEEKDFKEIRKFVDQKYSGFDIKLLAHVRCHKDDINQALQAGADGLNLYIGTSQESQKSNHGKTINQISDLVVPIISDVRSKHPHLHLRFSGEDAFRTKTSDLLKVYGHLAKHVNLFGMPDTVGVATPTTVVEKIKL
ncbi:MAG: homocitrate synthase, partial [Patescibacteria group bacterium]|nr:homocitrate synthase [Patescibacteria group bacterium]